MSGYPFDAFLQGEDKSPEYFQGVECLRTTGKAIQVRLENGAEQWIPRSVVCDESAVNEAGDVGVLAVEAWWAADSDLENLEPVKPKIAAESPEFGDESVRGLL